LVSNNFIYLGKGVYFADMVILNFITLRFLNQQIIVNYFLIKGFTTDENKIGCMLLSEVALGKFYKTEHADYNIQKKIGDCLSTYGVGD
jgi:hypothetical protein